MCKWHWRKVAANLKALVLQTWKAVQGRPAPTEAALEKRLSEIRSYREAVAAAVADVCRQEGLALVPSGQPTEGAQT